MTKKPDILPCETHRTVLFVAFPEMCLLDVTAPQTVFWIASKEMNRRRAGGYACRTASVQGGLVRAAEGVEIQTQPLADFDDLPIDTVMVPGSFFMDRVLPQSNELLGWLRKASSTARRTTSVCAGAFFLAQAGLLNGKRAATHWMACDTFQKNFPEVQVDSESLFVRHDSIWTSAGVSACIDLSLALIEEDCGRDVAMTVAQELVVFLKRPGGQSQFSQLLRSQSQGKDTFDDLHLWITNNLVSDRLTVEGMAERACMSPRNFARVYKQRTGRTPAKAVESIRLEAAQRMLQDSDCDINEIARLCGFGDEERMRSTFQRNLFVTPRDYRQRFL